MEVAGMVTLASQRLSGPARNTIDRLRWSLHGRPSPGGPRGKGTIFAQIPPLAIFIGKVGRRVSRV